MPKSRANPQALEDLSAMALVSDLTLAAEAVATGGLQAGQGLIRSAGRRLAALHVDRWERAFQLAVDVAARRAGANRAEVLTALADVIGAVGDLAGAVAPNQGETQ